MQRAIRGRLLDFVADPAAGERDSLRYVADGVLLVADGRIEASGPATEMLARLPERTPVDHYPQAKTLNPADDQIAALPIRVGQREAAYPAALKRADMPERIDPAKQPVEIDAQIAGDHFAHRGASPARTSAALRPTIAR